MSIFMKMEQIIARPEPKLILIQHTDSTGRPGVTVVAFESLNQVQANALVVFLALCRDKMPTEQQKPRVEVEREIADLEGRLDNLRRSLGSSVGGIAEETNGKGKEFEEPLAA